jgi:hypothetical protein
MLISDKEYFPNKKETVAIIPITIGAKISPVNSGFLMEVYLLSK